MHLPISKRTVASAIMAASILGFALHSASWAGNDPASNPIAMMAPQDGAMHTEQVIEGKTYVVSKTILNVEPDRIFNIIVDYPNAVKYFSNLTYCEVLSETNGVKLVRFKAKAATFMKLDYVLSIDQSKPNRIEWKREKGSFKANQGYWEFTPLNEGKSTLITYVKHVDPGFFTPPFMVHKTLRDTAEQIFRDLKRATETPQVAKLRQN